MLGRSAHLRFGFVAAMVCGWACGPDDDAGADESPGRPSDTSGMSAPSSADADTGMPAVSSDTTDTASDTVDPTDVGGPDSGTGAIECNQWNDDCPRREKCMPWSNDGSGAWNATRCVPLAAAPRAPGEPCTVEESAVSGVDDCERRAMCWNVDPDTNAGECVAMCGGSEVNPVCEGACSFCSLSGDGVVNVCLQRCDPLVAETCDEDQVCAPANFGEFRCVQQTTGGGSGVGAPCSGLPGCDAGLYCADAAVVPGCEGTGCCTPYCNPAQDDGCEGLPPGIECVPLYEGEWPGEGCASAPPGVCVVPS